MALFPTHMQMFNTSSPQKNTIRSKVNVCNFSKENIFLGFLFWIMNSFIQKKTCATACFSLRGFIKASNVRGYIKLCHSWTGHGKEATEKFSVLCSGLRGPNVTQLVEKDLEHDQYIIVHTSHFGEDELPSHPELVSEQVEIARCANRYFDVAN